MREDRYYLKKQDGLWTRSHWCAEDLGQLRLSHSDLLSGGRCPVKFPIGLNSVVILTTMSAIFGASAKIGTTTTAIIIIITSTTVGITSTVTSGWSV